MAKERKTVEIEVEVELTPEEKADKALSLAIRMREHKELEEKVKSIKKKAKLELDNSNEEIEKLRTAVETGKSTEVRECVEEFDYKKGIVRVLSPAGKFLHERKVTDDERQTELMERQSSLANKPDGNPVAAPAKAKTPEV